jgi:Mrp family chromosome partitioning ATPase
VAQFQSGITGAVNVAEADSLPFQPAWEVDRFRWPVICDDLQRDWASPLTGIVRSVVRQAWCGGKVVAVTQFGRSEGATTLALCLARIAAAFQIRVALVDGNAQNPDVGPSLGLRYDGGWEATGRDYPLEESAIGSLEDRLVVLPLGAVDQPSLMDDPAARRNLLERLVGAFELVVLDAGPVFVAAHRWFSQP